MRIYRKEGAAINEQEKLAVVYGADDHYAKYPGISMLSLFQQNEGFKEIQIFVLDCGIRAEQNKVLYLDCDTLVCGSLQELWGIPLGGSLAVGVQDTVDRFFRRAIGLDSRFPYLNSGVLLTNLKLWRKENLAEAFCCFIDRFRGAVPHHDQGIINGVTGKRRVVLSLKFNGEEKSLHPARDQYLQRLKNSPWGEEPLCPCSLKGRVKLFAFAYRHLPLGLFEAGYRSFSWVLHFKQTEKAQLWRKRQGKSGES